MDRFSLKKQHLARAIIFSTVFIVSIFQLVSYDIFWHLKLGEIMISSFKVVDSNIFSWTFPDHSWVPTYWLFEIMVFTLYKIFSFKGLIICKAFFIAFAYDKIWCLLKQRSQSLILALLSIFVIIDLSLFRFIFRPHIFSFVGLSMILHLYYNYSGQNRKKLLFYYPIILLFWVNLHSGVIYGILLIIILMFSDMLHDCFTNNFKAGLQKHYWLFLLVFNCFFALLFNPNGYNFFYYLWDHLSIDSVIQLEEFAILNLRDNSKQIYMLFVMITFPFLNLFINKRLQLKHVALGLVSLFLLFKGIRFIPIALFFVIPPLIDSLSSIKFLYKLDLYLKKYSIAILCFVSILYIYKVHCVSFNRLDSIYQTGLSVNKNLFPVKACEEIKFRNNIRLYNSFSLGGFIYWFFDGKYKIFQDGRIHAYPLSFFRKVEKAKYNEDSWQKLIAEYNINAVFLNKSECSTLMIDWIKERDWQVLFEDKLFFVAQSNDD